MIMIVQYAAYFYNEYLLQNTLVEAVLKSLVLNYDSLKNSQEKSKKITYNNIQKIAKQKLLFINIINELSRIELFLLSLYDSIQISKISQLKFQIANEPKSESFEGVFSMLSNKSLNIINEEEFKDLFNAFIFNPLEAKKIMILENIQ
ncbi:unnamed protein product [Paramecium octaurelia]|nr:unnamed protein product [Paramecium octaurelia]